MEYSAPGTTSSPSFIQETDGDGTPLTGHLIVIVVFEVAVTLSPIFIVTGLPSIAEISFPYSGTSMEGFTGSKEYPEQIVLFRLHASH